MQSWKCLGPSPLDENINYFEIFIYHILSFLSGAMIHIPEGMVKNENTTDIYCQTEHGYLSLSPYLWLYGWFGLDKPSVAVRLTFGFTLLTCFVAFIIVTPTEFRWFLIAETKQSVNNDNVKSSCISNEQNIPEHAQKRNSTFEKSRYS